MHAVIFIGMPVTGKSTFFSQSFADTHVRINGDMLHNKDLEQDLVDACCRHEHPFVVDKMNFTKGHRAPYLEKAKRAGFLRIGYYFASKRKDALLRNQNEDRREKNLPDLAIHNAADNMELPDYSEFDRLYWVEIVEACEGAKVFAIHDWE